MFGGDTKVEETDILDDNMYLLNTNTLKWTVPQPVGPRPSGRYGHTISTIGSTLYVFGGQCDDHFFDDLVSYDLSTLQSPNSKWNFIKPNSPSPPPRTNHTMITFDEKLYLFGGTDGKLWYSDTWCFDPRTLLWSQLDCAGYIPSPCEGHSATIVGDIMYVFGGRSSEGKDLGSLSALKIHSRKWFSFQNMGPGPSPRSGHSMTAFAGHKVLIMGGECPEFDPLDPTGQEIASTNFVYVLDTSRINYPPSANEAVPQKHAVEDQSPPKEVSDVAGQLPANQNYNNVAPPPYGGNPQSLKKDASNRNRSASVASELTPGFGYERVDVGDSGSLTDEPDSYQDSQVTTPKTIETPNPNSAVTMVTGVVSPRSEKQSEDDDDTAVIQQLSPTSFLPKDSKIVNESEPTQSPNKTAPVIAVSNSGTSSHYSTDSDFKNGTVVASPIDNNADSTVAGSTATAASSSVAASDSSHTLNELEQLKAQNAWYKKELMSAHQSGYQSKNNESLVTLPDPIIPGSLPSRGADDDEKAELINALSELKNELVEVQSNIRMQAEQASQKISLVEEERDQALYKIKSLETQFKSVNSPIANRTRDLNGSNIEPSEKAYQKEISELKSKIELLKSEKNASNSRDFDEPYNPNRDYDQIYARNVDLEQQLREFSDKNILANHESTRIRAQLDEITARYKTLEESTEDHVNIIAAATLTLSTTQVKLVEADKLLTTRNSEKAALLQQVAQLTAELESEKAQHESAKDLIEQNQSLSRSNSFDGDNIEALTSNVNKILAMWNASKMFKKVTDNKDRSIEDGDNNEGNETEEYEEIESPKVKALNSQLEDLQKIYESHQKASSEATRGLSASFEKISNLKQELAQSEEQRQAYENEIGSLKSMLQEKHAELQTNTAKLDTHQRSLNEVQEKLQQSNVQNNDRVLILEQHSNQLEQHVNDLEQQLHTAKLDLEDYEERFNQIESEYSSTLAYTTTSEKALNKTREELAKFREQNVKLLEEVNSLKLQVAQADDEENESLNSRGIRDTDSMLSGSNKFDRVGSGASRMSSTGRFNNPRQVDLQLRDLRAQIIILQEEKDDLQSKSLDLKKKLITQDEELHDANETIDRLVQENQLLYDNQQQGAHGHGRNQAHLNNHLNKDAHDGEGMYSRTLPRSGSTSKSLHAFSSSTSSEGSESNSTPLLTHDESGASNQYYSVVSKLSAKSPPLNSNSFHKQNNNSTDIDINNKVDSSYGGDENGAQPIVIPQSDSPVNPEEADQTLNSLSSELERIRNNRERLSGMINNNTNNNHN